MHPGQKLKPGARVLFEGAGATILGEVLDRHFHGRRTIRLSAERGSVADAIDAIGHVPLPPYIHRPDTTEDRDRYQTVFARHRGSVAAPTAGLHFDAPLLAAIDALGVERVSITLHVGYGTFKPVRAELVNDHVVDPEPYEIAPLAAEAIDAARHDRRRVIAVGTTTTRTLEDAARKGNGRIRAGRAEADIFIYPGHEFLVVGGLVTNFHLPKSSLLMLVAAFAGRERVLAAYCEAVQMRYRFYSYGDAMLIL
jgi:S-adenosylmethionine:tRNA ribosyltransferase-isomerase